MLTTLICLTVLFFIFAKISEHTQNETIVKAGIVVLILFYINLGLIVLSLIELITK